MNAPMGPQEHAATEAVYTEAAYSAKKDKEDKPAVKYIPAEVLLDMGRVFGFGAKKHRPFGWREIEGFSHMELYGKAQRHMLQWASGENRDDETKLSHIVHALCDLAMLMDLIIEGKGKDDRR